MTRKEVIRSMYHYHSKEEYIAVVPGTAEIIDNWYVEGYEMVEKLEKVFDIEDVYDNDLNLKIFIKDLYEVV